MREKKPSRVLELEIEIDAPVDDVWKAISEGAHVASWFAPQATVSRPGEGGEVTVAWAEGQAWTTKIGVWKPGEHLRWVDESGAPNSRCSGASWPPALQACALPAG